MVPSRRRVTVVASASLVVQIPIVPMLLVAIAATRLGHFHVLVPLSPVGTLASARRSHRGMALTVMVTRRMGYPRRRVRVMVCSWAMHATPLLRVLRLPLHLCDFAVELVFLLGAVVLEAHHWIHAAYSR